MSDAAYVTNLKKLADTEPTPDHISAIDEEAYRSNNDRAFALLLGSQLESNLLAHITAMKLHGSMNSKQRKRIFGYEGVFGTFSSKIAGAFALDLIGPITFEDLDIIRLIRNAFAHARIPLNFQMPQLIDICNHLKMPELLHSKIPSRYLARLDDEEAAVASSMSYSKTRYVTTCHQIAFRMFCIRNPKIFSDRFNKNEIILP